MKYNVLLIHADQLRCDCLEPYGNTQVKTPNLSLLARDGVCFDNHFCSYPVCTPSRYSLLSGLYVHQHLGWSNHCTLPPAIPTFPKILRENGWKTAAVGKMHFTPPYLDVGFDTMVLAEQNGKGRFCDDYHRELMAHGYRDTTDLIDQCSECRAHAPLEDAALFDLERDPMELDNRFSDPSCRPAREEHLRFLFETLAFQGVSPTYLDEDAPAVLTPSAEEAEKVRSYMLGFPSGD